jgi:hypothetical protein
MRRLSLALLIAAPLWLGGCDMLGIESATQVAERRDAEGKAVGGACRQAARSIEACYEQNKRADKAAVFAGWREMNDYMRENRMDPMPPPEETAVAAADIAAQGGTGESASPGGAAGGPAKAGAKGSKGSAHASPKDGKAPARAAARSDTP